MRPTVLAALAGALSGVALVAPWATAAESGLGLPLGYLAGDDPYPFGLLALAAGSWSLAAGLADRRFSVVAVALCGASLVEFARLYVASVAITGVLPRLEWGFFLTIISLLIGSTSSLWPGWHRRAWRISDPVYRERPPVVRAMFAAASVAALGGTWLPWVYGVQTRSQVWEHRSLWVPGLPEPTLALMIVTSVLLAVAVVVPRRDIGAVASALAGGGLVAHVTNYAPDWYVFGGIVGLDVGILAPILVIVLAVTGARSVDGALVPPAAVGRRAFTDKP